MKVQIESTEHLVDMSGKHCRIWRGQTEAGVPVVMFVLALCVARTEDCLEMDLDLVEMPEPIITLPEGGNNDIEFR